MLREIRSRHDTTDAAASKSSSFKTRDACSFSRASDSCRPSLILHTRNRPTGVVTKRITCGHLCLGVQGFRGVRPSILRYLDGTRTRSIEVSLESTLARRQELRIGVQRRRSSTGRVRRGGGSYSRFARQPYPIQFRGDVARGPYAPLLYVRGFDFHTAKSAHYILHRLRRGVDVFPRVCPQIAEPRVGIDDERIVCDLGWHVDSRVDENRELPTIGTVTRPRRCRVLFNFQRHSARTRLGRRRSIPDNARWLGRPSRRTRREDRHVGYNVFSRVGIQLLQEWVRLFQRPASRGAETCLRLPRTSRGRASCSVIWCVRLVGCGGFGTVCEDWSTRGGDGRGLLWRDAPKR
jgi:hypothetical protein